MPYCGAYLADLGAEVIKVETHHNAVVDTTRTLNGPFPDNKPGDLYYERGGTFHTLNRGKLSVTLDLRSEAALEVLRQLVSVSGRNAGKLHPAGDASVRAGLSQPEGGQA